jgi:hypothetical protein
MVNHPWVTLAVEARRLRSHADLDQLPPGSVCAWAERGLRRPLAARSTVSVCLLRVNLAYPCYGVARLSARLFKPHANPIASRSRAVAHFLRILASDCLLRRMCGCRNASIALRKTWSRRSIGWISPARSGQTIRRECAETPGSIHKI